MDQTVRINNAITAYAEGKGTYLSQQIVVLDHARDDANTMELAAALSHLMADLTYSAKVLDALDDASRSIDARLGAVLSMVSLARDLSPDDPVAAVSVALDEAKQHGVIEGITFALRQLAIAFDAAADAG